MKKGIKISVLIFLLVGILYYVNLPDYVIFNSVSYSNGCKRNTELNVIVYQYWGRDEIANRIRDEHNMINGIPTTLEIRMYFNKWYLQKATPFKIIMYE